MAGLDQLGDVLRTRESEDESPSRSHGQFHFPAVSIRRVLPAILILIAVTAAVILISTLHTPPKPLPDGILSKLDFAPFIVQGDQFISVDQASIRYSADQRGLIFNCSAAGIGQLVVSEQASPPEFAASPDKYGALVQSMHRLSEIQSSPAPIYITQPDNQTSGQTAVVNAVGVLLFIQSSQNLSDGEWRQVLSSFSQYQPPDPTGY